jgi:outer membrane lipopolysaccharide assembly protein LptE/RlpB
MKSILKLSLVILTVHFLTACKHNQIDIDTSGIAMKLVVFKRLDKDIFSLTPENVTQKTSEFQKKYTVFYTRYITSIINNGGVNDSLYSQRLLHFVTDKEMNAAYTDIKKMYSDNDVELIGEDGSRETF